MANLKPVELDEAVRELAESLAELKVSAALGAMSQVNLMIVDLLIRKGVINSEEVFHRLSDLETIARRTQGVAPTTSEYTLSLTMSLRDALEKAQKRPS